MTAIVFVIAAGVLLEEVFDMGSSQGHLPMSHMQSNASNQSILPLNHTVGGSQA